MLSNIVAAINKLFRDLNTNVHLKKNLRKKNGGVGVKECPRLH